MKPHKLGMHWLRYNAHDLVDFTHIQRMGYLSFKLFEWMWSDRFFCKNLLNAAREDSIFLIRHHPESEEKADVFADPERTGIRHAENHIKRVKIGAFALPVERSYFLGANELDATTGDRDAIDVYYSNFLNRLTAEDMYGGAFNFSTAHPRTKDGTPATDADYEYFRRTNAAIVSGKHIAVAHIYGGYETPLLPGHFDRLRHAPKYITWVIGEIGLDQHAVDGKGHRGYLKFFEEDPTRYCDWLDHLIAAADLPNIHSYMPFTYDYSPPWGSFDIRPIAQSMESYNWQHVSLPPAPIPPEPPVVIDPPPPTPPVEEEEDVELVDSYHVSVVAEVLNVRSGPGTQYDVIRQLKKGDVVLVDGETGQWLMLDDMTFVHRGWVRKVVDPGDWGRIYAFIRRHEGGWANHPRDKGGPTMHGITLNTFINWRTAQGLPAPTEQDLRNISEEETETILREMFWKGSGADKLPWPLNLAVADTAINGGVARARRFLAQSGEGENAFLAYMGHLIDWYTRLEDFDVFGRGWIRRRAEILLMAAGVVQ